MPNLMGGAGGHNRIINRHQIIHRHMEFPARLASKGHANGKHVNAANRDGLMAQPRERCRIGCQPGSISGATSL